MPKPKCPKCEGGMFEASEFQPLKSKGPLHAICCINCGTVIGIHDFTVSRLVRDMGLKGQSGTADPPTNTIFPLAD